MPLLTHTHTHAGIRSKNPSHHLTVFQKYYLPTVLNSTNRKVVRIVKASKLFTYVYQLLVFYHICSLTHLHIFFAESCESKLQMSWYLTAKYFSTHRSSKKPFSYITTIPLSHWYKLLSNTHFILYLNFPIVPQITFYFLNWHHSHNIKFTLWKCTIQWFLVFSPSCANFTTNSKSTTVISAKRNSV